MPNTRNNRTLPFSTVIVILVLVIGTILNCVRRSGTRTTIRTLSDVATPRAGILHSNGVRHVGAISIIPNSVVILNRNSSISTSKHLFTTTDLQVTRTDLANRDIPINGGASALTRTGTLNSHTGVIFGNASMARNANHTVMADANVNARINGVTSLLRTARSSRAPLRGRVGCISGVLNDTMYVVTIIILITLTLARNFRSIRSIVSSLLLTISLTITTIPRNLTTVLAIILTLNIRHVTVRGTVIGGLRSIRALKSTSIVYSSGANALAHGRVAIRHIIAPDNRIRLANANCTPRNHVIISPRAVRRTRVHKVVRSRTITALTINTLTGSNRLHRSTTSTKGTRGMA